MQKDHLFLYLGICSQLPWNLFITAADFFRTHLIHPNYMHDFVLSTELTFFGAYFAICFTSISLLTNIVLIFQDNLRISFLTTKSMLFMLISLFIITALIFFDSISSAKVPENIFFFCSLFSLTLCGISSQLFTNGILRLTNLLADVEIQKSAAYISTGQGLAGLFASVLQILTLLVLGENNSPTLFYFLLGLMFISYNYYRLKSVNISIPEEEEPFLNEENVNSIMNKSDETKLNTFSIFKDTAIENISLFLVFTITLAVFPSLTSILPLSTSINSFAIFLRPFLFLSYNIFSVLGRLLCQTDRFVISSKYSVLIICLLRVLLIPLFLLLDDKYYLGNLILHSILGFSTGYLTSVIYILFSEYKQDLVYTLALLSYASGLLLGSLSSLPLAKYYLAHID